MHRTSLWLFFVKQWRLNELCKTYVLKETLIHFTDVSWKTTLYCENKERGKKFLVSVKLDFELNFEAVN